MSHKHHSIIILDQSGSMETAHKETVNGFNEQIQEIKNLGKNIQDSDVTLVLFNTSTDIVKFCAPVDGVEEMSNEMYHPNGGTAMFDAIGRTLQRFKDEVEDDDDSQYLCIIISDGQENSSMQYTTENIAEMIQELQDTKRWTFAYIGANQDLSQIQAQFNIPAGNIALYQSDALGTEAAHRGLSSSLRSYSTSYCCSLDAGDVPVASAEFFVSKDDNPGDGNWVNLSETSDSTVDKDDEEDNNS